MNLRNLPEVPELLSGGGKIKTQICQTLKSILFILACEEFSHRILNFLFQIVLAFDQRIQGMRVSLDPKGSKANFKDEIAVF